MTINNKKNDPTLVHLIDIINTFAPNSGFNSNALINNHIPVERTNDSLLFLAK
jgi:hypothetical protein